MQFSPHVHDWYDDPDRQIGDLTAVMQDDRALARLLDDGQQVIDGAAAAIRHGYRQLEQLGAYVGLLGQLVVNDQMKDATRRRAGRQLLWNVISVAAGALPLSLTAGAAVG